MGVQTTRESHTSEEVVNWVKDRTGQQAVVHDHLLREEDDFLYLPVHVKNDDAFEVARFLQDIEDQWNYHENPQWLPRLVLVPTKN